ncbi:MAG: serine/threonine-protein kinase [Gemmatimonadaceae bacterium]|nr:serine/threonine-protein kinase [Gemmatimonadaceae bacterium]
MTELFALLQQALGDEYSLEREMSGTSIANVFLARERIQNRSVLVSVLTADVVGDLDFEQFFNAAERTAALDHPGIVPPIALGAAAGRPYIITPYVPGVTLRTRLTEQPPISLEEVVRILRDLAVALEYAHERGAFHLAITPECVLLSQKTGYRLLEFGIARDIAAAQRPGSDAATQAPHGGAYLAPEQMTAGSVPDHRADLFAWGCVAYEMLTGVPPFTRSGAQINGAPVPDPPPAPITLTRRDVPATLIRLITRCLSFDPVERPTAANLVQVLQTVDVSERAVAGSRHDAGATFPAGPAQPNWRPTGAGPSDEIAAVRCASHRALCRGCGGSSCDRRVSHAPERRTAGPERETPAGTAPDDDRAVRRGAADRPHGQ